jgi:hypothetical protein
MSTPDYYSNEAARCRALAVKSQDQDAIRRWLQIAAEYEMLAESMASVPPLALGAPIRQQEMQQQAKAEPDDKV